MDDMEEKDEYSPYCPICTACGEDGCCSALCCDQHPDGTYYSTYLKELKFAYRMYRDMYDLVAKSHQEELDKIWDKNYEATWDKPVSRKELRKGLEDMESSIKKDKV